MQQKHHKQKILLVDDDIGNLDFLEEKFQKDYLVLCADNGESALEILAKNDNFDIALILTDERMPPGITGKVFLEKSMETHPNTIRWLITAYPEDDASIYNKKENQVDRYIKKPILDKIDDLKNEMHEAIKLYELRREYQYLNDRVKEVIEKNNRIKRLFSKYLPYDLIKKFENKSPQSLKEVEEKNVTILYANICCFKYFTECLKPFELVEFLNQYLSAMSEIIVKHNGTIDHYGGDTIMAIFGLKEKDFDPKETSKNAICCAIEMKKKLEIFNKNVKVQNISDIHFRIGINSGKVIVGNIGSDYLLDYTVIGEVVGTAIWIRKFGKCKDNSIMLGNETYQQTKKIMNIKCTQWNVETKKEDQKEIIPIYELSGIN